MGDHVRVVEFPEPGKARLVTDVLKNAGKGVGRIATVRTTFSAISPGTELLAFKGLMPTNIPADTSFATQQSALEYPCRYGYCVVGVVEKILKGEDVDSVGEEGVGNEVEEGKKVEIGTRVFAFREHTSRFRQPVSQLMRVPDDVSDADAAFLPAVETALSIAGDAAIAPGDAVAVIGQGLIGLHVTTAFRLLYPYSTVATLDVVRSRRAMSTDNAFAHTSIDASQPLGQRTAQFFASSGQSEGADIAIDVSGCAEGLDAAIEITRDYGRVILASWFGTKPVTLHSLGGRFHRSHISLVASQVSNVPPSLSSRWSKTRRFHLAWRLIRDIRPASRFAIPIFAPDDCQLVYEQLSSAKIIAALFQWSQSNTGTRIIQNSSNESVTTS